MYLTAQGKAHYALLHASYYELYKVTWPQQRETAYAAVMVGVVVAIASLILWLFDSFFMFLLNQFIN